MPPTSTAASAAPLLPAAAARVAWCAPKTQPCGPHRVLRHPRLGEPGQPAERQAAALLLGGVEDQQRGPEGVERQLRTAATAGGARVEVGAGVTDADEGAWRQANGWTFAGARAGHTGAGTDVRGVRARGARRRRRRPGRDVRALGKRVAGHAIQRRKHYVMQMILARAMTLAIR